MRRRIAMRRVGDRGAIVRLPPLFWLYRAFRATFPRSHGLRHVCSFFVPGRAAMRRLGAFDALHGDAAARDIRDRERRREDAEWAAWEARVPSVAA